MMIGDASKERLIAVFLDHLIALGLVFLTIAFVPESLPAVKAVLFFAIYLTYFIILEAIWSRTVGKYVQGLVIRKLDGSPCDLRAALIRSALRIVEVNPLLMGGIPAGLIITASPRKQRLGDLFAGTLVVRQNLVWDSDEDASKEPDHEPQSALQNNEQSD